jgi:lactate permease
MTICSVLALAKIMGYSGMISAIAALLVAVTGQLYPLFTPLIGTLGGFVTGSGTSTQVLFGQLQVESAKAIGWEPSWIAAANAVGAGIGKMISPQGIAIGCAAAGLTGQESVLLKKVFGFAIVFAIVAGIICFGLPCVL